MSEENYNPLTMDLSAVDTSMPLIEAGPAEVRVQKAELTKTKDGTTPMLNLELKTVAPSRSVKGETLGAGITVFDTIMLAPRGKSDINMVTRGVAELVQAAKLTGVTLQGVAGWHKQLEGRVLKAKIGVAPEGTDKNGKSFRAKNKIEYYIK